MVIFFIILLVCAYTIGSIPFGLILARLAKGVDLRKIGSGNIGATNAKRAGGWRLGIAVLAADMAKGTVCVLAAQVIAKKTGIFSPDLTAAAAGLAAVCGHIFPVFFLGKTGGKGVATAAGAFLLLAPYALIAAASVFIIMVSVTKRVSAGSVCASILLPVATGLIYGIGPSFYAALACGIMITARHKDNIIRIINGTEPAI